jgi:lactoylglutathione lyase
LSPPEDLEKSVAFCDAVGLPEALRLQKPDGKTWIVCDQFGDELFLELFPGGDGPVPGPDVTGFSRLSLTLSDIAKAETDCAAIGIPLVHPRTDARGIDGNRGMWSANPDGHRMEFVEVSPDCIQYRAVANHHAGDRPHIHALG